MGAGRVVVDLELGKLPFQDVLSGEALWVDVAGMRNIVIHEHFGVDVTIIWHTIVEDLPKLKIQVRGLLLP